MPEVNQYSFGNGDNIAGDKIINHFHLGDQTDEAEIRRKIIEFTNKTEKTDFWTNQNTIFIRCLIYIPAYFLYLLLYMCYEILYLGILIFPFVGFGIVFWLSDGKFSPEITGGLGTVLMLIPLYYYITFIQKIDIAIGVASFFCIKICPNEKFGADIIWRIGGFLLLTITCFLIYVLFFYHNTFIESSINSIRQGYIHEVIGKEGIPSEKAEKVTRYLNIAFSIFVVVIKLYILYICHSAILKKRRLMAFSVGTVLEGKYDLAYVQREIAHYTEK